MNKAAVMKRVKENKDKSPYELFSANIINQEEYEWLQSQQVADSALPTVKETKGTDKLKTVSEKKAEQGNTSAKPVTVRRIDVMPQATGVVSLKPTYSNPRRVSSTAMATLRDLKSGKEKRMLRTAAERMAKSNPNFYEVI